MAREAGRYPGKLPEEGRRYVVVRLAEYAAHAEVIAEVKERYGVELTFQAVGYYDPQANRELPPKWRTLYDARRAEFLANLSEIGIANQAFRLSELLDLYRRAKSRKADALAAQILRQAAEEVGGLYTNQRKIELLPVDKLTPEQLERLAAGEPLEVVMRQPSAAPASLPIM
jgi:hypothetical protein